MKRTLVLIFSFALSIGTDLKTLDKYAVMALPDDFYYGNSSHRLNDDGQVAGYISNARALLKANEKARKPGLDPYEGAKAAYWDSKKGTVSIKLNAYKSMAHSINDNGFVVVAQYQEKQQPEIPRTILWNTKTDELKYGPTGLPRDLNNANDVLIDAPQGIKILWEADNNTIQYKLDDSDRKKRFPYLYSNNIKGTKLSSVGSDLSLFYSGKEHLLVIPEGKILGHSSASQLNDNDEVVAMIIIKDAGKNFNKIMKWKKDKEPTITDALQNYPQLKGYEFFNILGFNNKGQILLVAAEPNSYANPFFYYRLFLLTPIN